METMEHELKFLNMLGYKTVELQGYNQTRWDILDEKGDKVGTIQRKRLYKEHKTKGPAVFGYTMEINNDTIAYKNTRRLDSDYGLFGYSFDIKRESGTNHVEVSCGEFPSITIWSQEHGYMSFNVSYDGLFANFKSQTERFNIEEVVVFKYRKRDERDIDSEKEYTYQIGYCDRKFNLADSKPLDGTSRIISAKHHPDYQSLNQIEIEEITWKNKKLRANRKNTYVGTVEETIERQQMGIDAVSHFRHLLNSILPFKQEIMSAMLVKTPYVVEQGIELFLPDVIEQLKENPCLDCSTQGTCDMLGITEQNCITLKKHKQLTGKPYIKI